MFSILYSASILLLASSTIFTHMAFPAKQVRTLEERLHIIEEMEKNLPEKRTDSMIHPIVLA
jgi:hypothetical protein